MAGKRQHYIPRFLQAGFSAEESGNPRTWLYRRNNASPILVSLKDIGVKENFYAHKHNEMQLSADAKITDAENLRYAPLIQKLRSGCDISADLRQDIAEFLAHLEIRTKSFRDFISSCAGPLIKQYHEFISSPQAFRGFALDLIKALPSLILAVYLKC